MCTWVQHARRGTGRPTWRFSARKTTQDVIILQRKRKKAPWKIFSLRRRRSGWFSDSLSSELRDARLSRRTRRGHPSASCNNLCQHERTVNAPFLPNCPQTCLVSPTLSHPIQPSLFKSAHRHRLYLLQSINASRRHLFGTHEIRIISFSTASYAFLEPSSFSSSFHGFKALYLLGSSFFTYYRPVRACRYCPMRNAHASSLKRLLGKHTYFHLLVSC